MARDFVAPDGLKGDPTQSGSRALYDEVLFLRQEVAALRKKLRAAESAPGGGRAEGDVSLTRFGLLHEVSSALAAELSKDALCKAVVRRGLDQLEFERLSAWMVDPETGDLRGGYGTGPDRELIDQKHLQLDLRSDAQAAQALERFEYVIQSEPVEIRDPSGRRLGRAGRAVVPIGDKKMPLGLLVADNLFSGGSFTEDQGHLLVLYGTAVSHLCSRMMSMEQLRESDIRFRVMFEASPVGLLLTEMDGTVVLANQAYLDLVGRTEQEMVGANCRSITPEKYLADIPMLVESLEQTGRYGPYEKEFIHKDGARVPALLSGVLVDSFDGPPRVWSVVEDVSAQKQIEQELREKEQRLRVIVEAAPIPMLVTEMESGRILFANKLCEAIYDCTGEEMAGAVAPDLYFNAEDRKEIVRQIKDRGYVRGIELWAKKSDGSAMPLILSSQRVVYGGVEALVTGFNDMTELRAAQNALRKHQEELAHVMRLSMMGEMASGLAHELNQPLAAIANYAKAGLHFVDEREVDPKRLHDLLARVMGQATRAGDIIRHLRNLVSKRRTGVESVCINDLIRRVIDLLRSEAVGARVRLSMKLCCEDPPAIDADPIQIEQVLINLIRNAIESLSEFDSSDRQVVISTRTTDDGFIAIDVRDNGAPLTDQQLAPVFNPFYSTKASGMGMGLAISQSIAAAHEGKMTAKANPDGGATFRLALPITERRR